jgi:hypothetical protein
VRAVRESEGGDLKWGDSVDYSLRDVSGCTVAKFQNDPHNNLNLHIENVGQDNAHYGCVRG